MTDYQQTSFNTGECQKWMTTGTTAPIVKDLIEGNQPDNYPSYYLSTPFMKDPDGGKSIKGLRFTGLPS